MHAVFFGLKRAYQGTLRITRRRLKKIGLTAARFDLLYAVRDCGGAVLQSALRKILGVSRATVSKMLISLEKLGLIKRSVYPDDRRQRLVTLTWPGRKSIGGAYRDFIKSGWAELAFASAIGCTGLYRWYSAESCLEAKSWLLARLDALREGASDFASLEYPWDPEGAALDRLEDEAFEDPWEAIAEQEQREGAGRPPGVEPWNGEGPCPWDNDGPFPWDAEGVRTWKEVELRERMRRAEERRAERAAARLAKKAARRLRRRPGAEDSTAR